MSSQKIRAFQFAKQSYLALLPGLEQVAEDAAAAEEWIQTFSMLLELVYSSGANAGLPAGEDTEVTNFLGEARARLLGYASAAWLDHSSRFVAGHEERLRKTLGNGLPAIFPAYDGYVKLAECRKQMEAGQISHPDFLRYRLNVAIHDPADPFTCGRPSPVEPVSSTVASPLEPLLTFPTYDGYAKLVEYRRQMEAGQISRLDFERHRVDVHLNDPANRSVEPWASLVDPFPLPRSAGRSVEPFRAASPGLGLTPNSPAPLPYSLSAGTPPLKQAGVKRGRPLELIDVRTLDDYVRCEPCISSKTKCAPLVGTGPPYPCARCVKTGRECVRDPATRSRHNGIAMPSLGLPPALEEPSAGAFFGMGEELSGVALASVVTHWRGELVRSLAASAALTEHIKFVHYQYSLVITSIGGSPATSGGPPAKRARSSSSKEKVVDVGAPMKTRASSRGKVKVDAGARMETRASSKSKEKARMDVEDGTVTEAEDGAEAENWEGFTGDDL
ncbi:hypothetical protein EDB85DRAFT_2153972 [Lactarius pseudohatsudake]|nr:hypothetical protein EDB85DRAFT_2153972 [Lactarius pseudohatsudake]